MCSLTTETAVYICTLSCIGVVVIVVDRYLLLDTKELVFKVDRVFLAVVIVEEGRIGKLLSTAYLCLSLGTLGIAGIRISGYISAIIQYYYKKFRDILL